MNGTSATCIRCAKRWPWGLAGSAAAALLLLAALAIARDYYVSPNGNDANSGESPAEPWATLPHACENVAASAQDPAIIHLSPGEYGDGPYYAHGPVMWYDNLFLPSYVSLVGSSPHRTILNYWVGVSPGSALIEGITVIRVGLWRDLTADSALAVRNCITGGEQGGIDLDLKASEEAPHVTLTVIIEQCLFEDCYRFGKLDAMTQASVNCGDCRLKLQVLDTSFSCVWDPRRQTALQIQLDREQGQGSVPSDEIIIANTVMESDRDESKFLNIVTSGTAPLDVTLENALVRSSRNPDQCPFLTALSSGPDIALSMSNSTVVGGASFYTDPALAGRTKASTVDSIIHHSMIAVDGEVPTISAVNSCVSWPVDGQGVIHSDPLFAAGALGEHYLSHVGSGQAETSPCVDAGSILASESTVARLTTRTDHEPDTGTVDMGFHYGRRIGPKPYMELGHEGTPFCPDEDLTAYVLLKCEGAIMLADVYLAAAYGDQLFYLSDDGWTRNRSPWMRKAPIRDYLPDYFSFPIHFPENIPTGTYTIYLGLFDHYSGELVSLASTQVEVVPN